MCLFQLYQLVNYKVLSLLTNLAFEFSTPYCSPTNCTLASSLLRSSHISRRAERSSVAKKYLIIWVEHSQACNKVVEKNKKLNGIKIYLTNPSPLYKENCMPGVKRVRIQVPLVSILAGNHSPFYREQ